MRRPGEYFDSPTSIARSILIVVFIIANRIDKSGVIKTPEVQPAHVVKEKHKERNRDDPWRSQFNGVDPSLFLTWFGSIEIGPDVAFEILRQIDLFRS